MSKKEEGEQKIPLRPRLVLRAGFAGRKELTEEETCRLKKALAEVLHTLGRRLAEIAPGVPVKAGQEPKVSTFFERRAPLLRLVTGLCEGADEVAAQVLETVKVEPDAGAACEPGKPCLETELGAVLPFDVETYRRSRPQEFQPEFDRQLARCAWVLVLDGHYDKPTEAELNAISDPAERKDRSDLAALRRGRAYRAQSAFLLRQSDLLIAAADPSAQGKAGGTLETVREALQFDLPVVFIHTGTGAVHLLKSGDDLHSVLAMPDDEPWDKTLVEWVNQITTDPDRNLGPGDHTHDEQDKFGEQLLAEYFDQPDSPGEQAARRMVRFRKWAWERFEKCFSSGRKPKGDPKLEPYAAYRSRATELNYHYSGLYRGAFLLNYAFAILAIALATVSSALLGKTAHSAIAAEISEVGGAVAKATNTEPANAPQTTGTGLLVWLLALAAVKLLVLLFINRNTTRANRENWNDRAVDFRYLAERLRTMYYLPRLGAQQPPAAAAPQFASRAVRQSAMDWLFDSITRAVSPADLPGARSLELSTHDGTGTLTVKKLLTFDAPAEVERIRDVWIAEQTYYHERNARTHHNLHRTAESVGKSLGLFVIVIVCFDILFIIAEVLEKMHLLPHIMAHGVHSVAPYIPALVVLTALLPAIVAALGGIRFQSECRRLAERSAVMRVRLGGRVPGHHEAPPTGLWSWLRWRIIRFFKTTWLVLRHVINKAPAPPETKYTGGRWEEADALAKRIAAARENRETDPAAWSHDALRLAERTADDFVQEAAEWSVLYAKELAEPG